jgi:hypothetical protein
MNDQPKFTPARFMQGMDFIGIEVRNFERDVHIIVLGTLYAGIDYLRNEAAAEAAKLEPLLSTATGEAHDRLVEDEIQIWSVFGDQERFLRNLALVGLLSRLFHTIRAMATAAEAFAPRSKEGYGNFKDGEMKQLGKEFKERFGIVFSDHQKETAFLHPLIQVRNKIVHAGGEPNKRLAIDDIELEAGDEGFYDLTFSKKYPEFIEGEGGSAQINVSLQQLHKAVESSINMLGWISEELHVLQDEWVEREDASGAATP